jgi:outer membrane protein assembly factor BamE (lipoprotein component of BamABCDE complex)
MKHRLLVLVASLLILSLPVGTVHAGKPKASKPKDEETEPSKRRPHRGMTKAQVRKTYGDPDNQQVTSRGETWFYFFNKGHYFIPYYFGKPRTSTFHFNEAGILTEFEYNQED